MTATNGVTFDDPETVVQQYHDSFRAELPTLLSARGRLLTAQTATEVVGVGALLPIDLALALAEINACMSNRTPVDAASDAPCRGGCWPTPGRRDSGAPGWRPRTSGPSRTEGQLELVGRRRRTMRGQPAAARSRPSRSSQPERW
jgi:hypothetical protein